MVCGYVDFDGVSCVSSALEVLVAYIYLGQIFLFLVVVSDGGRCVKGCGNGVTGEVVVKVMVI